MYICIINYTSLLSTTGGGPVPITGKLIFLLILLPLLLPDPLSSDTVSIVGRLDGCTLYDCITGDLARDICGSSMLVAFCTSCSLCM